MLSTCVIVPAAGSGSRLGCGEPKAFVRVNGRTLLARSLETIISSGVASAIVVAAPEDFLLQAQEEIAEAATRMKCEISITAVAGGSDRNSSVQTALKLNRDAEYVLVHDAARCLTPPDVFTRVVAALQSGAEAVVPVLPMVDTVRRVVSHETVGADSSSGAGTGAERASDGIVWSIHGDSGAETTADRPGNRDLAVAVGAGGRAVVRGDLDRAELRRVQTPQGFRAEVLRRAHDEFAADWVGASERAGLADGTVTTDDACPTDGAGSTAEAGPTAGEGRQGRVLPTDDAGLVERLGVEVVAVDGDEEALKITYPLDLVLAEQLARMRAGAVVPGPGAPDSAKETR
ncbi:2-C-methyl-D-erythritol 4-phosphate cytidylyltransferase [Brevibacterium sediminis]|nr:2-C-methyl-D-erythritol 4-phosphate cytidylyltransferase [Brevibacterium sediminis]